MRKQLDNSQQIGLYMRFLEPRNGNMRKLFHKPHHSPLRRDDCASFSVFMGRDGDILWHDHALGETGDIYKLYSLISGYSYKEACEYLNESRVIHRAPFRAGVLKEIVKPVDHRQRSPLNVRECAWTPESYSYWERYGIDIAVLEKYRVKPITSCSVMEMRAKFPHNPMYVYHINDGKKVYAPLASKGNKWRGNVKTFDVQGWEQVDKNADHIVITKSLKDVMVLYTMGINAIAPESEGTMLSEWHRAYIRGMGIPAVVFFDNDDAGIKAAQKYFHAGWKQWFRISAEYAKDVSDLVTMWGFDTTKEYIWKKLKNEIMNYKLQKNNETVK